MRLTDTDLRHEIPLLVGKKGMPMLVKCICTNCAGHLEFEEENVGEVIQCPHCGFDTALFLPGSEPVDPESIRMARRAKLRRRVLWIVGPVILLAVLVFAAIKWVLPVVQDVLPSTVGTVGAVLVMVLGGLGLVGLALWVLFPIFVFLESRKITELLARIEINLRPTRTVQVGEEELETAEETEATELSEQEVEPL
jgi:hypothetical protein